VSFGASDRGGGCMQSFCLLLKVSCQGGELVRLGFVYKLVRDILRAESFKSLVKHAAASFAATG
jgi:hypothetical protein